MRRLCAVLIPLALSACQETARISASDSRVSSVSTGEGDRPIWDVKCPTIGTVVRYSDGRTITWAGEDPADDMACVGSDLDGTEVRWILGLIDVPRDRVGMYRAALAGMFPARAKATVSFRVAGSPVSTLEDWEVGDKLHPVEAYGRSFDVIRVSRVVRQEGGDGAIRIWAYLVDAKTGVLTSVEGVLVTGERSVPVPAIYATAVTVPPPRTPERPASPEEASPSSEENRPIRSQARRWTTTRRPAPATGGSSTREPGLPPVLMPLAPEEKRGIRPPAGGW